MILRNRLLLLKCSLLLIAATQLMPVRAEDLSSEKLAFVSDIDDTIKVTNVLDYADLLYRYWRGNTTFAGMSTLYQGLAQKVEKIAYLSGSPQSQKENLVQLLFKKDQFPEGELLLSNWWLWKSTDKFKLEELTRISKQYSSMILIGDDSELDPATLNTFKLKNPELKLRIYIHRIRFARLPEGERGFSIPFEVALAELEEGGLTEDFAIQTGEELLKQTDMSRIFPNFKRCPSPETFNLTPGPKGKDSKRLQEVSEELTLRIKEFCLKRGRSQPLSNPQ